METVRGAKSLHAFAPMCLDSRNSSAEVRSHCFVQQVRVESSSWESVGKFLELVFSGTLDRGPERGLRHTYLPNLDTFPYWRPLRPEPDVLNFDADDAAGVSDPLPTLAHMLDVAGIFHSLDNIGKKCWSRSYGGPSGRRTLNLQSWCFTDPAFGKFPK